MRKIVLFLSATLLASASVMATAPFSGQRIPSPTRAEGDAVIKTPEGDVSHYKASEGYIYISDATLTSAFTTGDAIVADLYFSEENNDVYFRNPIIEFPDAGEYFIKGTRDGDLITFEFPQLIYEWRNGGGDVFYYYANRLRKTYSGSDGVRYNTDADLANRITFVIGEDGVITCPELEQEIPEDGMPNLILGCSIVESMGGTLSEPFFGACGGCNYVLTPFDEKTLEVPADVKTEQWALIDGINGRFLNVGFDGDDVYIGSWDDMLGDTYVKGTVNGDKIEIPAGQYLGRIDIFNRYFFLLGAEAEVVYDEFYEEKDYELGDFVETISLNYDEEARKMSVDDFMLIVNGAENKLYYLQYYFSPTIIYQGEDVEPAAPNTPIFEGFMPYSEDYGYGLVRINMPKTDVNGNLLDVNRLYYNLYIGEDEIFEFYPDEYMWIEDFTEDIPLVDVPYNFEDDRYDFLVDGTLHTIYIYSDAPEFGCKMVYITESGERLESALGNTSGVKEAMTDAALKSTVCYDMFGRRILEPERGLWLETRVYEDGTVRTVKRIR